MQALAWAVIVLAIAFGCERGVSGPRLLVLSPEVARVLVDLEVAEAVVGADERSRLLPELGHTTSLGALEDRHVPRAIGLAPTLALGVARDVERRFAAELGARGVQIELFDPRSMDEVVHAVRQIGTLVGQREAAYHLTHRVLLDVTKTAVARDGKRRRTVAWIIDRDPLTVVGGTGLLHEVLELAGAENAVHATNDERVVLGESGLAGLRYDTIVDATGEEARPSNDADANVVRIAPDVAALPAFDVTRRVRLLHERLYSERAADGADR
jgi:ABC-type hemin transport system substrate-binding protein